MKRIILFPIMIISFFAFSQNIRIKANLKGIVTDFETSEVLPFVNIVLFQNGEMVNGTLSDFDGHYSFTAVPIGEYELRCTNMGYKAKKIQGIEITKGKTKVIDINMNDSPQQIFYCTMYCFSQPEIETPTDLFIEQDSINKMENKLLPSTGFETSIPEADFIAYPNPTLGLMTLTNVPKTDEMLLFDMSGKIIRTIHIVDDKPITLDLSSFESGMYILKYTEFGQQKTKKLIKQ